MGRLAFTATAAFAIALAAASAAAAHDLDRLPLGDGRWTTEGPRRGWVYTCRAPDPNAPGSRVDGPWIDGDTFSLLDKAVVDGSVSWPGARVSFTVREGRLRVSGNGLPTDHRTGRFPISSADDAFAYDRNPNPILSQRVSLSLPATPRRAARPACMSGQAGVAVNGVAIFNALDAPGRDAVAHEIQDACDGHPQRTGLYHYHSGSRCLLRGARVKGLVGWALDGYPIFGPEDEKGHELTNAELDACHGRTETVTLRGRRVRTYLYRLTYEFPYSVSCFRGTPVQTAGL